MTPTCPESENKKTPLSVQWHITTRCGNRCRHCYLFDDATFSDEKEHTLPLKGVLNIFQRLLDFEGRYNAYFSHFAITGGDPLLREDWQELITELRRHGRNVVLMGNPETLTPENLKRLSELGVRHFQMSLDGLEKTHDAFRSPGSFQRTVEALHRLAEHHIRGNIMFTLFPKTLMNSFHCFGMSPKRPKPPVSVSIWVVLWETPPRSTAASDPGRSAGCSPRISMKRRGC